MTPELFQALDEGAAVVTANHRQARSLRHEYGQHKQHGGASHWPEPYIVPWFGWLERSWRDLLYDSGEALPPALNTFQEEVLWESAIHASPAAADLLQPAGAARAAVRAWALVHAWRLPLKGHWWDSHRDSAAFLGWARGFQDRLRALGYLDPASLADFLRPRIPAPPNVWFAGFDELTQQQLDLIEMLEAGGSRVTRLEPAIEPPGAAALRSFPNDESEWEEAAHWARAIAIERPRARIGVIVPDLAAIHKPLSRVFGTVCQGIAHVSGGAPMLDCPPIHAAFAIAELLSHTVPLPAIGTLLLSPFVRDSSAEAPARAAFDAWLRSQGRPEWPWRAVRRQVRCPEAFGRALEEWEMLADSIPARQSPGDWARTLSKLLGCFGWNGGTPLYARAWDRALSLLASLDLTQPEVTAGRALSLMRRIAARYPVELEDRGEPVQILSLSEAPGMEFDALWIAGMDALSWPRAASPNPFVPISLQRERNLPRSSAPRELEYARRVTRQLLASAPEVVVSYARGSGEVRRAPSPLFAGLPESGSMARYRPTVRAALESVHEQGAPPLDEGTWHSGGVRALQLQAACPFRAFAEIRLAARPLESPDIGLDPREKGKVLHTAMEILWRELGGSERLRAMDDATLSPSIEEAVSRALRDVRGLAGEPFEERLRVLESRRLGRLLHEWLAVEKKRGGGFEVAELESKHEVEAGGLRLRTRVDRADRVPTGLVLLDYKSGQPSVKQWEGDRPDEPQLPLYAVTRNEPVAAVAFAQIRTGAVKFKGWSSVEGLLPGVKSKPLDAMVRGWREALTKLGEEFRAGEAGVTPKAPDSCAYCHLHSLCRISAARPETSA